MGQPARIPLVLRRGARYRALDGAGRRTLLLLPASSAGWGVGRPPGLPGGGVPHLRPLSGRAPVLGGRPLQEGAAAGALPKPSPVARRAPGPHPAAGDPVRGLGSRRGAARRRLSRARRPGTETTPREGDPMALNRPPSGGVRTPAAPWIDPHPREP